MVVNGMSRLIKDPRFLAPTLQEVLQGGLRPKGTKQAEAATTLRRFLVSLRVKKPREPHVKEFGLQDPGS